MAEEETRESVQGHPASMAEETYSLLDRPFPEPGEVDLSGYYASEARKRAVVTYLRDRRKNAAVRSSARLSRTWIRANLPTQEIDEIQRLATQVFEDPAKATQWLQDPNLATFNKPPISLVGTPAGFDRVKQVLMRIEFGNLA